MALVGGVGQIHGLGHLSSRINWIQWRTEGGGCSNPSPKFRRYRWSPRSHEQEEPASRFRFL